MPTLTEANCPLSCFCSELHPSIPQMTDIDPKQVGPSLEAEAFMDENLEITDTFAPLPEG